MFHACYLGADMAEANLCQFGVRNIEGAVAVPPGGGPARARIGCAEHSLSERYTQPLVVTKFPS
jgi:hypothetical protein